jgi:hypothetical protein
MITEILVLISPVVEEVVQIMLLVLLIHSTQLLVLVEMVDTVL